MVNPRGVVLSGIQPTAEMHLGNFFGAISNWIRLQELHDCRYFIADLHAMTMPFDPVALRRNTEMMAIELIACGIDPLKSTLFIQSLVPEHTELYWILSCQTAYGDLSRMTQFKDKSDQAENEGFISLGLFGYPALMAADILIYRADYVPVGHDQQQHLELSRAIARRFNERFGKLFPLPGPLFTRTLRIASLADPTKKMSKSLGPKHFVGLFEDEESVRNKVRAAVVDSGRLPIDTPMSPGVTNLLEILSGCGREDVVGAFRKDYSAGIRRYAALKDVVADTLVELTGRLRANRDDLMEDRQRTLRLVREMSDRARETAQATLRDVRARVGLPTSMPFVSGIVA